MRKRSLIGGAVLATVMTLMSVGGATAQPPSRGASFTPRQPTWCRSSPTLSISKGPSKLAMLRGARRCALAKQRK